MVGNSIRHINGLSGYTFSTFTMKTFHEYLQNAFTENDYVAIIKFCFMNTIEVPNSLDPDQARCFVGADPAQNCLQRLTADYTSR